MQNISIIKEMTSLIYII